MRFFIAVTLSFSMLLSGLLSGCSTFSTANSNGICPALRGGITFCLLEPSQLPAGEARHMVRLQRAGTTNTFIGILVITDKQLQLHGLSPLGLQLFHLRYDGDNIHINAPKNALPKPALLVALLQLMVADMQQLNQQLHGDAVITQSEDDKERLLLSGENKIIIIHRNGKPGLQAGYSVKIPAADMQLELRAL